MYGYTVHVKQFIELLMKDWYIRRHEREESLAAIVQVKESKDALKAQPKP